MNKTKLSFASVLIALVISVFTVCTASAVDSYAEEHNFLMQLGITDGISKQGTEPVTRAEFAAMTVRMLNSSDNSYKANEFKDIDDSLFFNEICIAKDMGIVSGTSLGTYSPDDYVAYPVAAKMLSAALGYSSYGEALGGYPTGYLRLASQLDILKGVEQTNTALTYNDAVRLIYNALHADVAVITGIFDDRVSIEREDGKNLLTESFGLSYISGVLDSVGYYSKNPDYGEADIIKVKGKELKTQNDYSEYFALKCNVWYDAASSEVVVIEKDSSNKIVQIDAKYVTPGTQPLTVNAENEAGTGATVHRLSSGFTYVLNGRPASTDANSFRIKEGTFTLIDYNEDGRFDVVKADKKDYFVVRSVSEHIKTVYDNKSATSQICFDNGDETDYKVWVNGIKASYSDLKENMVLEVYMSKDFKLCRIYASDKSIYGEISALNSSEGKLLFENKWYDLNSYFETNSLGIDLGSTYEIFLASDGTICEMTEASSNKMQYGYLLGYKTTSGLDATPLVKLLNINNEIKIYNLSEKISFNGTKVSSTSAVVKAAFENGTLPRYQLIKYSVSADVITAVETSTDYTGSWVDIPSNPVGTDFTKYLSNARVHYRASDTAGAFPSVPLSQSIIFAVPKEMRTDTLYKDEDFRIWTTSNLNNNSDYYVDVFDYDDEFIPAVVVMYQVNVAQTTLSVPSQWLTSYMVAGIHDALNPDGDAAKMLEVYTDTGYQEFYFDNARYDQIITERGTPGPGDVVRIGTNVRGYITNMIIDVNYNDITKSYTIDNLLPTLSLNDEVAYIGGEAVNRPGSFFAIEVRDNPNDISSAHCDNVISFRQGNPYYLIFNKTNRTVRLGNSGDIVAKAFSGGAGSDVVLRNNYCYTNAIFVYED